jgi:hypothetical protein
MNFRDREYLSFLLEFIKLINYCQSSSNLKKIRNGLLSMWKKYFLRLIEAILERMRVRFLFLLNLPTYPVFYIYFETSNTSSMGK